MFKQVSLDLNYVEKILIQLLLYTLINYNETNKK